MLITEKPMFHKWNKNILFVIPEYTESAKYYQEIYRPFSQEFDIIIVDWENLYHLGKDLKFNDLQEYVLHIIEYLEIDTSKIVFIGSGVGASIISLIHHYMNPLGCLFISPIFSTTLVNPYTSNIPSYKNNLNSYFIRMQKEYYKVDEYFGDRSSSLFTAKFRHYLKYQDFFDTAIAQICLYDSLKAIRKKETHFCKNTAIFMGVYDEVVDLSSLIKSYKFKHFKNQVPILVFEKSSHHIELEETKLYLKELKKYLNEWTK